MKSLIRHPVRPAVVTKPTGFLKPAPGTKAAPSFGGPATGPTRAPVAGVVPLAGFSTGQQIVKERNDRYELMKARPFEFGMKVNEGGINGVEIVFTDKAKNGSPPPNNSPFFCYMHRWGFEAGQKPQNDLCIKDGPDACALCAKLGKEGAYEMMLTCIDKRPFTPASGPNAGKRVLCSKKLYVVKSSIVAQFERLWMQYGTFRGMVVKCFRDNDKAARGGSTINFVKFLTEAELANLNKQYKDVAIPTDYAKAFPRPSADEHRQRYGGTGDAVGDADHGTGGQPDEIPF